MSTSDDHSSEATTVDWPPLPLTAFISGRVATQQDIDQDIAAFGFPQKLDASQVAKLTGGEAAEAIECAGSTPLAITIPQYAILNLKGEKIPCILIQGEQSGDAAIVGCRLIRDDSLAIGLLEDFELLGQDKPA